MLAATARDGRESAGETQQLQLPLFPQLAKAVGGDGGRAARNWARRRSMKKASPFEGRW